MALLFWDASALAKRYAPETGSDTVDAVFANAAAHTMAATVLGYAESFSILLRKRNGGRLDLAAFTSAVTGLQSDTIDSVDFAFLAIDDAAILSGIPLIQRHNLNSADAVILAVILRYARLTPGSPILMVSADHRLLRAAQVEGMRTLDPESFPAVDVASLLASL
jgi:uncharacterized protein